jgi:glutamate/tyrosine decarboxylase-like PLP-dependent enzyme
MENNTISQLEQLIRNETFDMDPEESRTLGYQVVDLMIMYLNTLQHEPILPQKTFQEMKHLINEPLPQNPQNPHDILQECQQKIITNAVHIGNPRLLGWMLASGTAISAFAEEIASTLNQNVSVSGSTIATVVELLVLDWMKQILGYDAKAGGILVSGGSMANLTALTVARNIKADFDVTSQGMIQQEKHMTIYVSSEVHHCVPKAAHILGIGTHNIRWVKTDENQRLDPKDLIMKINEDLSSGKKPFCVVATAGTVNTGAIDPLDAIADICQHHELWFHVDAAYGGFAALSDTYKPLLKGIERADSVVLDPHKWLFIPYEAGCVLVKNSSDMKQTFTVDAPYIHTKKNVSASDEEIDFSDYGIQLSRQFRALKIWMSLKQYGIKKYQQLIEQNIHLAQYLEAIVNESKDFENAAPAGLSTVCFRYYPQDLQQKYPEKTIAEQEKINDYLNLLNRAIIEKMRMDGRALLSSTILENKFVLRACIMNYRTTKQDIRIIIEVIRELGKKKDVELRKKFL